MNRGKLAGEDSRVFGVDHGVSYLVSFYSSQARLLGYQLYFSIESLVLYSRIMSLKGMIYIDCMDPFIR